jgi:hypothetical protein
LCWSRTSVLTCGHPSSSSCVTLALDISRFPACLRAVAMPGQRDKEENAFASKEATANANLPSSHQHARYDTITRRCETAHVRQSWGSLLLFIFAIHGASCTPTSVEWSRLIDRYPAPLISGARPGFSPGRRVVALPVAAPRHLPDDAVPPAPSVPEAASETDAPSPFRPRVPRTPRLPSHLYYHKNHHHQPSPPTKPPLTPSIEK